MKLFWIILFLVFVFVFLILLQEQDGVDIKTIEKMINDISLYNKLNKRIIVSYPIYYINMDRDNDRKIYMESHLPSVSNNFKRVRGFNGYKIKNTRNDTIDGISFLNYYSNLTKGEIGCTMSHLIAIKTAHDNGDNIAIISEDDTSFILLPLIEKIETIIADAPKDWEILQLFAHENNNDEHGYRYIKREETSSGAVCYVINIKGMKKILDHTYQREKNLFKIYPTPRNNSDIVPPRGVADVFIYDLVTTYTLQPSIVFPYNTTLSSTIHDDHTPEHLRDTFNILKSYEKNRKRQTNIIFER